MVGLFAVLNVVSVVKVSEHIEEESSVEREEEIDAFGVIAIREHDGEVVVEDYAELDLKLNKNGAVRACDEEREDVRLAFNNNKL